MSANNYKIVVGGNTYNLSDLIETSGFGTVFNFNNFPISQVPASNFQKLANNINYRDGNTDLSNVCIVKSRSGNTSISSFRIPAGINKISGIFAAGGGGGGGGGGIAVVKNFPVTEGSNVLLTVGSGGTGTPTGNTNNAPYGSPGNESILQINGQTLLFVGGGGGGESGESGNANNKGVSGVGGDGGFVNFVSSNMLNFVTRYSGATGSSGGAVNKGNPGTGGDGGSTFDVNADINNASVYLPYTSPVGKGSNTINTGGAGGNGGNAPGSSATSFSGGGGGGAGSGQGRHNNTSGGGNGANGFVIVYLYF
jgi:hypothetical protein